MFLQFIRAYNVYDKFNEKKRVHFVLKIIGTFSDVYRK